MNFYEFAGAHPILVVVLAVFAAHTPVAIIRALRAPHSASTPEE